MEKIKNLSLRKTIFLYMAAALVLSFFLTAGIQYGAQKAQMGIWRKYVADNDYYQASQQGTDYFALALLGRSAQYDMMPEDSFLVEACDFLYTWSPLAVPLLSSVAVILLFYRNKIRKPLDILMNGAERISSNDLDFGIVYPVADEMGRLCSSFEKMRVQLEKNNRELWSVIEREKTLKAAVAHDIRSPLAVLKGYQEMLLEFIPQEKFDPEMLENILQSCMQQTDRLNQFAEMLRSLSGIEEREVVYSPVGTLQLLDEFQRTARVAAVPDGPSVMVVSGPLPEVVLADASIIYEVYENILGNALRYARERIQVRLDVEGRELVLECTDDGDGFQDGMDRLTEKFYHSGLSDDLKHFGLGLYLCRIYCEKHGGRLLLGNRRGGACVKASFGLEHV